MTAGATRAYVLNSFRTISRVFLRPLPIDDYCVRIKETRLNVTAQWRDHLNRERGSSQSQHDLTRFLNETLLVVYHLHGKTSRFTVWLNGKQFRPDIAFTISTNQFHLPKKRPRKPETGIKDGFEEMENEYSVRKNWTTFSNVPLL